jgi:hypothetical protein
MGAFNRALAAKFWKLATCPQAEMGILYEYSSGGPQS